MVPPDALSSHFVVVIIFSDIFIVESFPVDSFPTPNQSKRAGCPDSSYTLQRTLLAEAE